MGSNLLYTALSNNDRNLSVLSRQRRRSQASLLSLVEAFLGAGARTTAVNALEALEAALTQQDDEDEASG